MKKNWITLAVGLAVLAIFGSWFAGDILKTVFPQYYVRHAASNTINEIRPQTGEPGDLAREIFADSWRQEIELGFNNYDSSRSTLLFSDPDPDQINEFFSLFSISANNTTGWNNEQDAMLSNSSIQMLGNSIFDIDFYFDRGTAAFKVPQAYDNFIFGNAQSLITEWRSSPLDSLVFVQDFWEEDADFYKWLSDILVNKNNGNFNFYESLNIAFDDLVQNMNIRFGGRSAVDIEGVPPLVDVYHATISDVHVNSVVDAFYDILREPGVNLILPWNALPWSILYILELFDTNGGESSQYSGIELTFYISASQLLGVDFTLQFITFDPWDDENLMDINVVGEIRFTDDNRVIFDIKLNAEEEPDAWHIHGSLTYDNTDRVSYNLNITLDEYRGRRHSYIPSNTTNVLLMLDWDIHQPTGDNFAFELKTDDASMAKLSIFSVNGSIRGLTEERRIEADFSQLRFAEYRVDIISEIVRKEEFRFELSLNARYSLQADNSPISFDRARNTILSDLTEENLNEMIERLIIWFEALEDMMVALIGA
ncbi:MAG: hypothetical protein FWC91_00815 [Defluviitaleaceae bacterium]|nr:hypothetical protein [Defluviitaleaceae bacterium]